MKTKSIFNQTKSVHAVRTKTEKVEMANIQKSVPEKEEAYHLPGMVVVQWADAIPWTMYRFTQKKKKIRRLGLC